MNSGTRNSAKIVSYFTEKIVFELGGGITAGITVGVFQDEFMCVAHGGRRGRGEGGQVLSEDM